MSKYESMSDEELGGLVTGEFYDCKDWSSSDDGKTVYHCGPDGNGWAEQKVIDINSWTDMGPIIEEAAISIWSHPVHGKSAWSARVNKLVNGFVDYQVTQDHENPLRAAAIIYLESLEVDNA